MLKLRVSLALLIAAAFFAFHLLYVSGTVPFSALNVIFLLISPAAYIYSGAVVISAIVFSWVGLFPLCLKFYPVGCCDTVAPLFIFTAMVLVVAGYRKILEREQGLWDKQMNEMRQARQALVEHLDGAIKMEDGVKSRELAIINLYEVTKKMSEGMRFDDIAGTLKVFLKENFAFRRCALLIFKQESGSLGVDRKYVVRPDGDPEEASPDDAMPELGKLAAMILDGFKDIYISRGENAQTFESLGITDSSVETLTVVPLLSEKKMVGLLAAENLPKSDLERLVILSMQFALEIKKVLLYEMVEQLAITDSLTGLYVRRHFYERLDAEFRRSKRYGFRFAFMMLDIDDFKRCNDTYGHLVGDMVLRDVARIVRENVREIDIVSRYGGEEIALALPETGEESACVVAERVRRKVEERLFKAYDEKVKITVSIGIAIYPDDATEEKDLIERADRALYAAKKSGKNVVCLYKKEYNKPH